MACDAAPGECLNFHVRSRVPGAGIVQRDKKTQVWYFTAPCPAHDDRKPSMKISEGEYRRFVWFCHAGCSDGKIRHALRALRIESGCLPRSAAELADLEEALRKLLTSDLRHADVRLRAMALLDSPGGDLPRGAALAELSAAVHVSRSEAYRALADKTQTTK